MASEFDPIRPVHPSWRGRPVPERGDESKRHRRWPGEREDASDEATEDSGARPDADPSETDQTAPERSREPPADGTEGESGHHVDDYA